MEITLSLVFWILYIISIVIFAYRNRDAHITYILEYVFLWIMIGILGYTVFNGILR